MRTLGIDIETYSSTDLMKSGVYKYVEAPDFEILLFGYRLDNEQPKLIDLTCEELPQEIIDMLQNPFYLKVAWNASFERACIAKHFLMKLPVTQWQCTMSKASQLGLPLSLDAAGKVLKLDTQKDAAGKALIKYFAVPCKPTKANGERTRNMSEHAPDKWQQFKDYCLQDVVVEQAIDIKTDWFTIPEAEKRLWWLDQQINDRGVLIDPLLVKNAIRMDVANAERLKNEAVELTGLSNPNSAAQLKEWIGNETDTEIKTLNKEAVPELLKNTDCEIVKRVLQIRQEMSKTSIKKYEAMSKTICADSRVRGLLQYYGANRTGRWAGRLVQVQNLPRNELKDLSLAREVVLKGDLELLDMLFGNTPDVLSQLIRTAFIASPGHRLIVADFSAIEARVIAWLAGERWRLDVFNSHGKIYEASASQMFKVPIEAVTKGSDFRQRGKVSELALGYQGGPDALVRMGALKMGLQEEELPKLVKMWRNANKAICAYWNEVGEAAIEAVQTGEKVSIKHGISFFVSKSILFIQLPSGRKLSYIKPKMVEGKFGLTLTYEGMDQTTKQWKVQDTYGGKLVENIVQAVARDCLAESMLKLDGMGYKAVLHVHDEIVFEEPEGKGSLDEVLHVMRTPISWAKGLPLDAAGFETEYYKKD